MGKRYKKKRYRKKRGNNGVVVSLGRGAPFPATYIAKHRYVETFTLDPGIGTPDVAYYSATNLFDPTVAAGGHQPLGYDSLTPIYDRWTVLGAKATIRFVSGDDSSNGCNMVYCYINDDSGAVLTYDTVLEQNKGVVRTLTSANAKQTTAIVQKFSTKKFFGVADVKDNAQLKGHSAGTAPENNAYFVVGAQGIQSGANPTAINCNIVIDYIVMWTERKDLAQS